jgi:iron complex transport system permease protein
MRLYVLIAVSLLGCTAVAFVGTIGFVGLVGPHVARMLVGKDQRYFLPASALAGGLLLSLSSIVSKSIVPGALIPIGIVPIGIVTSLVGVPFFLGLVASRRRSTSAFAASYRSSVVSHQTNSRRSSVRRECVTSS